MSVEEILPIVRKAAVHSVAKEGERYILKSLLYLILPLRGLERTKLTGLIEKNGLGSSSLPAIEIVTVEQAKATAEFAFASQILGISRAANEVTIPIFAIDDATGDSTVVGNMHLPIDRDRLVKPGLFQTVFHPVSFISLVDKFSEGSLEQK